MLANLKKLGYGSDTFERDLTMFWLNGDLVVSPMEQLDFLRRMFRYELPVKRAHVDVVKRALLMPEGAITNAAGRHPFPLAWPKGTRLIAKTGNTRVADERVSWLVGDITANGREYVFVSRVRAAASDEVPTTAGADVARKHLDAIAVKQR
jgi:beta-lactamase class D